MTILQSLVSLYDRPDRRGAAPKPGYAPVGISFAIPIEPDGSVGKAIDLRDPNTRRPTPVDRMVPKVRDHNNSGKDPFLFWDNTGYALGIVKKEMKRGTPSDLFEHFRSSNLDATSDAKSRELLAFRAFLTSWTPERGSELGIAEEDLDANVVFRCVETGLLIHEVSEAQTIWQQTLASDQEKRLCLVTGDHGSLARLHPKFPALEAGGNKAPLVSFNEKSFESYGKDQGANAPVSEAAAFKYGAALNWLLDRNNARSFRLGETTVVFWADDRQANVGEEAATEAEKAFWAEFGYDAGAEPEPDADAEDAATIGAELAKAATLRGPSDLTKLQPNTRVHVLGLSPNAGRIAVRFWLVDTFGHLGENLKRHKRDMAIEPPDRNPNQKAYALLYETAVQRKAENIPPRLGGELARAILTGGLYPRTLLAAVIGRIRADKEINAARAGLCKAVINRDHDEEVIPVALDPQNLNPAYRLGRLFALIEGAQKAALPKLNATVKDRYFGSACATPARVFPLLHKNAMNHIAAVRKERGGGLAHWLEAEIGQIWSGLSDDLPKALRLEEQGRFIAGYYHQRFSKTAATPAEAESILASDTEGDDQ